MTKTILIFGNSGSGKSTLARQLSDTHSLPHMDLDTVAWQPYDPEQGPPERTPLAESEARIRAFTQANPNWVIEGCYSDLLERVLSEASDVIFMDLPVDDCIANARQRPWEPHKYPSKAAQDANLEMLVDWIRQYDTRDDTFSRKAHQALYAQSEGRRRKITRNQSQPL